VIESTPQRRNENETINFSHAADRSRRLRPDRDCSDQPSELDQIELDPGDQETSQQEGYVLQQERNAVFFGPVEQRQNSREVKLVRDHF
jgi:hypothetical protein